MRSRALKGPSRFFYLWRLIFLNQGRRRRTWANSSSTSRSRTSASSSWTGRSSGRPSSPRFVCRAAPRRVYTSAPNSCSLFSALLFAAQPVLSQANQTGPVPGGDVQSVQMDACHKGCNGGEWNDILASCVLVLMSRNQVSTFCIRDCDEKDLLLWDIYRPKDVFCRTIL